MTDRERYLAALLVAQPWFGPVGITTWVDGPREALPSLSSPVSHGYMLAALDATAPGAWMFAANGLGGYDGAILPAPDFHEATIGAVLAHALLSAHGKKVDTGNG